MHSDMEALQLGNGWFPEAPGGLERVYHALWEYLPQVGVGTRGLVVGSGQVADSSEGTVRAFASPEAPLWKRWWQGRRAMLQELEGSSPGLVASHFALYALPLLDAVRERPFVVHFHGPWAWEGRAEGNALTPIKAFLERQVYRRADRCIVLSEAFRDLLCQRYDIPGHRVRIVPGGVRSNRFDTHCTSREARERLGWPTDRHVVLAVRRLAKRMGLEHLIEAMDAVRHRVPDALLLIAGKGPLKEALAERVADRGLEEHVRLLGFVPDDDLPLAYRAADLSVVPTVALEGFGLITLESLAAGTPVLVTPVGGLPETVRDLEPALVLEDATAPTLARGIVEALHGQRPLPDAEACRCYVRDHFDWPVIARQVRDVYEEVL